MTQVMQHEQTTHTTTAATGGCPPVRRPDELVGTNMEGEGDVEAPTDRVGVSEDEVDGNFDLDAVGGTDAEAETDGLI